MNNPRVANYANKVINNRYLIYTNENLLYLMLKQWKLLQ